jgi:flavin reductase (DIM6/NTAB) family NADH-FMN oxidoreductase RutF
LISRPITIPSDDSKLFANAFRRACFDFPAGLALFAAVESQDRQLALIISRFLPVSNEPAMIAISLKRGCLGPAHVRDISRFSLSLLQEDQDQVLRRIYRERSDPLQQFAWDSAPFGVPAPQNVALTLFCKSSNITQTGDHDLLIGDVKEINFGSGNPLLTWRNGLYRLDLNFSHLADDNALKQFIQDWEGGTLDQSRWNHAAHVTIMSYYGFDHNSETAYQLMKEGILHYNLCVGIANTEDSGYHETLTRFWNEILGSFLRSHSFASRLAAVREAVKAFGHDREYYRLYYSFDIKRDRRARQEWVAPDRISIPF